jgi:hypothetical protein
MSQAIETFKHNGNTIRIFPDFDGSAANPRDCDNLGTFWTQDRRYNSPDALPVRGNIFESITNRFGGDGTAEGNAKALSRAAVWLPVWKYEHSGVAYAAAESNPFSCPWDSGQVGYIFVTREEVRKEFNVSRITPKVREKVLKALRGEVAEFSKWANGEVYGYTITDSEGDGVDSCWAIIGLDAARALAIGDA